MAELKPCPFCGGVMSVYTHLNNNYWPLCKRCGIMGASHPTEADAVEWANTRAPCPECADGEDKIRRWQDQWDRLRINQSELAELLGQPDLLDDERQQLAVLRVRALEAVAEAARRDNRDLLLDGFPALYYTTAALAVLDATLNTAPDGAKEE